MAKSKKRRDERRCKKDVNEMKAGIKMSGESVGERWGQESEKIWKTWKKGGRVGDKHAGRR